MIVADAVANGGANNFSAVVYAIIGSGGFYTIVLFLLNWNGRRVEAGRTKAAAEKDAKDAEDVETKRLKFIHDAIDEAADKRYASLQKDYDKLEGQCDDCRNRLTAYEQQIATAREENQMIREDLRSAKAAIRAIVRAVGTNDQAAVDEAVAAAGKLV